MKITELKIIIEPTDKEIDNENCEKKTILFSMGSFSTGNAILFPRDIRLLARLEELIKDYNYKSQ